MTQYLNPTGMGDYSQFGLSLGTATDSLAFAAGIALDTTTMRRRADAVTITDEVRIVFENLDQILGEAGLSRKDIVKTTCYLSDAEHRPEFLDAFKSELGAGPYPHRCTFILGLAADTRVQIDAIAERRLTHYES